MKLSQGVEWSLHCTSLLAMGGPGTTAARRTLAGYYGLPEAYLAKHLKSLVRAGLLQATSGPRGGFRLARAADEISVLDVVEAVEGSAPAFLCQEIRQRGACGIPAERCASHRCAIDRAMADAEAAWRDALRARTIADLVDEASAPVLARARAWLAGTPTAELPAP